MANSKTTGAIGGAAQGAAAGAAFGPWGAAIGGIAGGIGGFLSGGGEDEAKELAEEQVRLIRMTTDENIRVMSRQLDQDIGYARAAVGASNLLMRGSSKRFIDEMRGEWLRSMSWEKTKGRAAATMARKGGQMAANQIETAGMQSMIGGLGAAASTGLFGSYNSTDGYTWDPWKKG